MTETVSESGSEDVLSSIRRLVATEDRSEAPPEQAAPEGRLLLTPALRVAAPQAPDEEALAETADRRMTLEERISELEAAVGRQAVEWEPDGSEDADQETPRSMVIDLPRAHPAPEPEDETVLDAPAEDAGPEEVAATIETAADPATPEVAEIPDPADTAETTPLVFSHRLRAAAEDEAGDAGGGFAAGDAATGPAETADRPHLAAVPDPAVSEAPVAANTDRLDDEALRALVARVVHEELRGEFGEKITRNVRRMVRREIERALAARDLD